MNKLVLPILAVSLIALGGVSFAIFDSSESLAVLNESVHVKEIPRSLVEEIGITDNVHFVVKDSNGEILQEGSTHNKWLTLGENCISKMVFGQGGGDQTGTSVCIGEISHGFTIFQLGEDATAVADGQLDLIDPADETGLTGLFQSDITWTNSTDSNYSIIALNYTFTNTGSSETINEVGLFNSTDAATNGMAARATAGTPYVIPNGGTLDVIWTFNLGSATVP